MSKTILNPDLRSTHDAAAAIAGLRARVEAEAVEEEAEQVSSDEGSDPEPETDESPASGAHEGEDEPEAEESPASVEAPASWPKDRIDEWSGLPEAAKEYILSRESEFQSGVAEKGREAAEAKRKSEEAATRYQEQAKRLDDLYGKLHEKLTDKWSKVDWQKLATEDPEQYVRQQADLQADQALLNRATAEKAQKDREYQQSQFQKLIERNPQYAGDDGRKKLSAESVEVEAFLRASGLGDQELNLLSAELYEAARDALEFRKTKKSALTPSKAAPQKTAKPGARKPSVEPASKALAEAKNNLRSLNKAGAGRNTQNAALAAMIALKRQQKG